MTDGYSLADIGAVANNGNEWVGNSALVLIILFALIFGWGGNGFGNRNACGENLATQGEVQRGFDQQTTTSKLDNIAYGICQSGYENQNLINGVNTNMLQGFNGIQSQIASCCCDIQRGIDSVNYNGAMNTASINANTTAQTQKILDAICENRMNDMQNRINQLELQSAMCGVVRYPQGYTYNAGASPFCGCGNSCCNNNF